MTNAPEIICRAMLFAARAHVGHKHVSQRRDRGIYTPYITYLLEVAHLVTQAGGSLASICAALLHDFAPDSTITEAEAQIVDLFRDEPDFGRLVIAIVRERTDPKGLSLQDAKAREIEMMSSGQYLPETRLVIVADQLANVRSLVENPPGWGDGIEQHTEQEYILAMERLITAAAGTATLLEERFWTAAHAARELYDMN